jgi:hypothetical protein
MDLPAYAIQHGAPNIRRAAWSSQHTPYSMGIPTYATEPAMTSQTLLTTSDGFCDHARTRSTCKPCFVYHKPATSDLQLRLHLWLRKHDSSSPTHWEERGRQESLTRHTPLPLPYRYSPRFSPAHWCLSQSIYVPCLCRELHMATARADILHPTTTPWPYHLLAGTE